MNFFNNLSLKYKISGLVMFCNLLLIAGSVWSLKGLNTADAALGNYYWIFSVVSLVTFGFATFMGFRIAGTVENLTGELAHNTGNLDEVAAKIAGGATELSSAATEQAAALQQTVATIDQIGAMIHKNSEAAGKSKELSIGSKLSAEQGRHIVDSMMAAISEIETNNTDLSNQMHDSNKQLAEITKLIYEISTKTQVINDIVFQTKLLSFNAAVEAARAGEYGYGFAVVADEIGKLAQRSGGAAKEITSMLQDSVGRVEFIIEDTKNKVDKIMMISKEKINFGAERAKHCKDSLDEILTSVQSVDALVVEISTASREQSLGVNQVSHAMNQLETVTNQNSAVAQASSTAGEQLRLQSDKINNIVKNLNSYISGSSEVRHFNPAPAAHAQSVKKAQAKPAARKAFVPESKKPVPTGKKVLKFERKGVVPPRQQVQTNVVTEYKKVAGYDGKTPSGDDPGFRE